MSVSLNALGTETHAGSSVTTYDFPITTVAASESIVLIQLVFNLSTVTGISVRWDPDNWNDAMTKISETTIDGTNGLVQLWGVITDHSFNSASKITVSWTTASDIAGRASAWNGVKQTSLSEAVVAATPASGNTSKATITITSATGNQTIAVGGWTGGSWPINPTQTQDIDQNTGSTRAFGSYGAGAASVTHAWDANDAASKNWVLVGGNIVAADAGGGATGLMWI